MKNLGVDVIYIINRLQDYDRKESTISKLEFIENLNYEIIQAVTGESLPPVEKMLKDKTIFKVFTDPIGRLTKNIYATAMSHQKVYSRFLHSEYKTCLILEDDIEFTENFHTDFKNGDFKKFIKEANNTEYDILYWGRTKTSGEIEYTKQVTSKLYNVKKNTSYYGAHAYQINKQGAKKLIEKGRPIKYAADVLLESIDVSILAPKHSYLIQEYSIADNTQRFISASSTQEDLFRKYDSKVKSNYVRNVKECKVYRDIPIEKITFLPRKLENGAIVENWASIYLNRD